MALQGRKAKSCFPGTVVPLPRLPPLATEARTCVSALVEGCGPAPVLGSHSGSRGGAERTVLPWGKPGPCCEAGLGAQSLGADLRADPCPLARLRGRGGRGGLSSSEEISPHRGRGSSSGPENRGARVWGRTAADAVPSRLTGGGAGADLGRSLYARPCLTFG